MARNSGAVSKKVEIIDVFSHFIPKGYLRSLPKPLKPLYYNFARLSAIREACDIDFRIERITKLGISRQILTLGTQLILDDLHYPIDILPKLARIANDEMANTISHKDHFYGVGAITLYDVGKAIDELDRCINDLGFVGVQIDSNIGGKPLDCPDFEPFYDRLTHWKAGLWIHPAYMRESYKWIDEYHLSSSVGWEFDESLAMIRLARSGVLERHPDLKVITHHLGVIVPFFADRISRSMMQDGKDGKPPKPLRKHPMDYLRMFYVDTAEGRWKPALVCSEMFYGPRHMLFGTDFPFGPLTPSNWPRQIIRAVNELEITSEEKEMIFGGNARKLFKLQVE